MLFLSYLIFNSTLLAQFCIFLVWPNWNIWAIYLPTYLRARYARHVTTSISAGHLEHNKSIIIIQLQYTMDGIHT